MKRKRKKLIEDGVIGFDTSRDVFDVSVMCVACWRRSRRRKLPGPTLWAGDEWTGLDESICTECGHDLADDGLIVTSPYEDD